jgi:thiamine-monophosphate kinase
MNGKATHIVVSIAMSSKFSLEAIEELYIGLMAACEAYQIDLVGGDTTSISKGLVVNITVFGQVSKSSVAYRNGVKEGDLLVVSGDLGAAYLGLHILEREKRIYLEKPDFQPDLEGNDYIIQRQLKPEARIDIVKLLEQLEIQPTAMIDISDGLASELFHLCKQSETGCQLFEEKIPIDPMTHERAREFNIDPTVCALSGGEDYELLFTIPLSDYDKVANNHDITVIGHMTHKDSGLNLVTKNGLSAPLKAQGWDAFK